MKSKWITHPEQSDWQIVNVFGRQLERKQISINPEDQNLHILFRREFELAAV